jgi:hypothetical protein
VEGVGSLGKPMLQRESRSAAIEAVTTRC